MNNRYQAIFGHFQEVLSCFYCCLLRTCGISIALVIHSFDPTLGLKLTRFWRFYTPFAPLGLLKAGAQCAPYKCTFQTGSKSLFEKYICSGIICPETNLNHQIKMECMCRFVECDRDPFKRVNNERDRNPHRLHGSRNRCRLLQRSTKKTRSLKSPLLFFNAYMTPSAMLLKCTKSS